MSSIVIQGDTSGSITVEAPSVAGTHTLTLPKATGNIATDATVGLGTKNLIINGNMQIAQRGTSTSGITSSGYYTVDRFDVGGTTWGTFTQSQDTDVPTGQGFANSIKFLWTTANASLSSNSFLQMHQSIEGQMLQQIKKGTSNAESLTISFWVKSNKTGTYIVQLYDIDNTRMISKSYIINSADTWEKKTITCDGDTTGALDNDNGRSLDLIFALCAGTDQSSGTLQTTWGTAVTANRFVGQVNLADAINNYWQVTGIQLELGENATPFEHRMYSQELAMCQRYFQSFGGSNVAETVGQGTSFSTTNTYVLIHLLQTMRSVPSLGYSAVGDWRLHYPGVTGQEATVMAISTNDSNNTKVIVNTTTATNASMGGGKCIQLTADSTISARLTFSAEL